MTKNLGAKFAAQDDDRVVADPPVRSTKRGAKEATHVWIQLEENENIPPTGQYIGANGKEYILRPGEPALVPISIIRVLDDAKMSVPQTDPSTRQILGYRERLRFPYRMVNAPQAA